MQPPTDEADPVLTAASPPSEIMDTAYADTYPATVPPSSPSRARRKSPADALMTAEWMVDVPGDLAACWYVAARPAGRRCLVVTSGGLTRAHGRSGKPRSFPSALPNGSRATRAGLVECELDCIWREAEQTYYVLDVLVWKGQRLTECTSDFRLFWLATKLHEARATDASSANPCRFVALGYAPCTPDQLRLCYAGDARPPGSSAMDCSVAADGERSACAGEADEWRDGLLLLHREALYEAGASPLLLSWSDASCSRRFYDYGSEGMAGALTADPTKADKWRTSEVDTAVSFADVVEAMTRALEQPAMAVE